MSDTFPFLSDLLTRYQSHTSQERFIIGVVGAPASGKSTIADKLVHQINNELSEEIATICRMDAYHKSNAELERAGLYLWKGCHFTFDAAAYLDKLCEIKRVPGAVSCPIYDRRRSSDPIDGAHQIAMNCKIVITEGNYLHLNIEPWRQIPALLDYCIYLEIDDGIQLSRLLERHQRAGRSKQEALAKAQSTDIPNTALIRGQFKGADSIYRPENNF